MSALPSPLRTIVCALLLAGCAGSPSPHPAGPLTLAGDPRLPAADIATFFGPTQWQKLRELEFAGYVIYDGSIREDGSVAPERVAARYPDASRDALAHAYVREVVLRAVSVGSRLNPRAEVTVIFYQSGLDGPLVLVFGRERDVPNPGTEKRAMYLHTEHY